MKKKYYYKKRKLNDSKNRIRRYTLSFENQKNTNIPSFKNNTMTNNILKKLNVKSNNNIIGGKNKLFKNIKLYKPIKHNNHIKRNLSFKKANLQSEDKFTYKFNNNINLNYNLYDYNHTLNKSKNNSKSLNKKIFKSKSNNNVLIPLQNFDNNRGGYINSFIKPNYSSSLIKYSIDNGIIKTRNININSIDKINPKTFDKNLILAEKVKKLKKEKEEKENEIKNKNIIIKEKEIQINELMKDEFEIKQKINHINDDYKNLKNSYQNIVSKNKILNEKLSNEENMILLMQEKELKLLRILYLIKEKGIYINDILEKVDNITQYDNDESNEQNSLINSYDITSNLLDLNENENYQKIDFNLIQGYNFSDEEENN